MTYLLVEGTVVANETFAAFATKLRICALDFPDYDYAQDQDYNYYDYDDTDYNYDDLYPSLNTVLSTLLMISSMMMMMTLQ